MNKKLKIRNSAADLLIFTKLVESSTCAKFAQAADNGKAYQYKFYNLPAIIADFSC